jgi:hypothetical protein
MNILTSAPSNARPLARAVAPVATESSVAAAPTDSFQSGESLQGPLSRAIYGAALYGIPAIAGITMGINGVLPGALVGAGIGAATHLENGKQAAIFAATGAAVGAGAAYIGFLGAGVGFKLPAVIVAALVGAGTQALYAANHQQA